VGCGGVGSWLAAGLARMGVTNLTLVDHDDVERSNLPRLPGARPGDVGEPKVRVVQQQCLAGTPSCEITTVSTQAQEAGAQLRAVDVIVSCVDNVTARYWLNEFAVRQPRVDVLTHPMTDGDLNHVMTREAAANEVRIEVDLGSVLRAKGGRRVRTLGGLRKLRELLEAYDAPFVVSGDPSSHLGLRAPRELIAVGETIAIERLIAMPESEKRALGEAGRRWFEENDRAFQSRLARLLAERIPEE
jgi:RNase P/RNase MRP subunit p30